MSSILIPPASSQHNLYDIYLLLCIQYWTPDDGQKTCPKHVEFYTKMNLRNSASLGFYCSSIFRPIISQEEPEQEYRYSSTLSLTSTLDGGAWSTPRFCRFTPRKDPVLIVQEAG